MKTHSRIMAGLFLSYFGGIGLAGAGQEYSASGWSDISSNLTVRVSCPRIYEVNPTNRDIYVKCEVRNMGKGHVPVLQRARLYLVDESGQTHRCLMYTDGVYPAPVLGPGETTHWWQHGKAPRTGAFKAYVRLEGNEYLSSAMIPVSITNAPILEDDADADAIRRECLQRHADEFLCLVPNTTPGQMSYATAVFTNDPVIVDGWLYNGFSFVMPEHQGDLVWSFVLEEPENNNWCWYIIPDRGSMEGFSHFETKTLILDIPHVGKSGSRVVFQRLPRSRLIPGQRYLIWINCLYRDVPHVTLSLNVLDDRRPLREIFSALLAERGR